MNSRAWVIFWIVYSLILTILSSLRILEVQRELKEYKKKLEEARRDNDVC